MAATDAISVAGKAKVASLLPASARAAAPAARRRVSWE